MIVMFVLKLLITINQITKSILLKLFKDALCNFKFSQAFHLSLKQILQQGQKAAIFTTKMSFKKQKQKQNSL